MMNKVNVTPRLYFVLMIALLFSASAIAFNGKTSPPSRMPEFTQTDELAWINSEPLRSSDLREKTVLIVVWTYGCWNCYNSFPWLRSVEKKFADQAFTVIGIHTPEFDHEKNRKNVIKKAGHFELDHPIMMDNDFAYWHALRNKYWPSYYIVDKKGNIRSTFVGETHIGDQRAEQIEKRIAELLDE